MRAFEGDVSDPDGFKVVLHDGEHWVKALLVDTYRFYIQEQNMPQPLDIVHIVKTFGGPSNLLIVSFVL